MSAMAGRTGGMPDGSACEAPLAPDAGLTLDGDVLLAGAGRLDSGAGVAVAAGERPGIGGTFWPPMAPWPTGWLPDGTGMSGDGGGGNMIGGGGGSSGVATPGPLIVPMETTPAANTTVTTEPWRALPAVVPAQTTVAAPTTTGAHGNPCRPWLVEKTATGTVPIATPGGTVVVRAQRMLPSTVPGPFTAPAA
jgi:hypothetical protein